MSRQSIASSLLVILLAAASASRAEVIVEPAAPVAGLPVTVSVVPDADQGCLLWTLSTRIDFSITIVGSSPPPADGCPFDGQVVDLGRFNAGRYHLEARRPDGTIWSEVYFTVIAAPVVLPAAEIDIRPARPTSVDPVDVVLSIADNFPCFGVLGVHDVAIAGDTVTITLNESSLPILCPPTVSRQHGFLLHLPPLAPGLKSIVVLNTGVERRFTVAAAGAPARLADRFEAHLSWRDPAGGTHEARPEPLSDASVAYSFADPGNVELTVKALDGRPVNGKFWIFAASLTDQLWELRVIDRGSPNCSAGHCDERVYKGIAHQNANVLDTHAFDP